jgi:hypothetical protein
MDREALAAWIEEGLSLDQIGRRTGRHPSTVSYWLRKHGLEPANRDRHVARGPIARATLEKLLDRGLTTREIAEALERSQTNVRYWLNRYGLRASHSHRVRPDVEPDCRSAIGECPKHGPARFVRRPDGPWRCVRCRIEAVTKRRRAIKELLVEEAGGRCALCGYDRYVGALHFHHVEPQSKSFDLGRVGVTQSLERARDEARKCVLLCGNCHAEVEAGVAGLPS